MTFDQFCRRNKCTYAEKDALAWHLSQIRARHLYKQLRPQPRYQQDRIAS